MISLGIYKVLCVIAIMLIVVGFCLGIYGPIKENLDNLLFKLGTAYMGIGMFMLLAILASMM